MGSGEGKPPSERILPNMGTNIIYLLLNTLIGLMMVPYYETRLGIAAYGIIPLATSVTSYMTLISNSFSMAIARFMSVDVQKNDKESLNRTYSTTAIGVAKIVLMMLPLGLFIALMSPFLFDTPNGVSNLDVQILFAGVICSALITSWGLRFQNALYAMNRLDLGNTVRIIQISVQVSMILLLFHIEGPSLWIIGVAHMTDAIVAVTAAYLFVRKVCPDLRIDKDEYDKDHFREVAGVSGWSLVESIGTMLMLQTSMVITNIILGPESNGELGFISSIVLMMTAVGGILNSTFMPLIHYGYSSGKVEENINNIKSAIKVLGIFMALPTAFVCVFSTQILTVWVGAEYAHLDKMLWIMLFFYPAFAAVGPLTTAGMSYLKVRALGLSNLVCGILNVAMVIFLMTVLDWGLISVAVSWTISSLIQKCIFVPMYYGNVTGVGRFGYMKSLAYSMVCMLVAVTICFVLEFIIGVPSSLLWLIAVMFVVLLIYVVTIPNLALNRREKDMVRSCLPKTVRTLLPKWFL